MNGPSRISCINGNWTEPPNCLADESRIKILQRRRKILRGKLRKVLEDNTIDDEFAKSLDLTCVQKQLIRAPEIANTFSVKYSRRRRNSKVFITAVYSCAKGYELRDVDKLYCSQKHWIGKRPVCKRIENKDIPEICDQKLAGCEHKCVLQEGEPVCVCYEGFDLDLNDGKSCIDINECLKDNGDCEGICVNKPGSYECTCPDGLQVDSVNGRSCIDINECLLNNGHGPCQDTCENTWGSYICSCGQREGLRGTRLAADGHKCLGENDCLSGAAGCSHNCINLPLGRGAFCTCPDGWELMDDWKTCRDVDECKNASLANICSAGCINILGSYYCNEQSIIHEECSVGFKRLDNGTCVDIDECLENNIECHYCQNTIGSYQCKCNSGYQMSADGTCEDINECLGENICPINKVCENSIGSYGCICKTGYMRVDDQCKNANPCGTDNGGCSHYCATNEQYEILCSCPAGYILSKNNKICEDFDECANDMHNCEQLCMNTNGSFTCSCRGEYFLQNDNTTCKDIDECVDNNGGCSHICTNFLDGFECKCPINYELLDKYTCRIINSCLECNGGCEYICEFNKNQTTCQCHDGYTLLDDGKSCADYDECAHDNDCSQTCINLEGSYGCTCNQGFYLGQDNKTCIDINECLIDNGNCSNSCVNTLGSWKCECDLGHMLSSNNLTCIDIDECILQNPCTHDCVNKKGGYDCICPKGYTLSNDMVTCIDVNECLLNNGGCSQICENNLGSYNCKCYNGYSLSNNLKSCLRQNKCLEKPCSQRCRVINNEASCYCKKGYKLLSDMVTCVDIDECEFQKFSRICEHICINEEGDFKCACNSGYKLSTNGKSCQDVNECQKYPNLCEHQCVNAIGSYKCLCPEDHVVLPTGGCMKQEKKCTQLSFPENGRIDCVEENFVLKCSITCTDGYVLFGKSELYCNQSIGTWNTDTNIECIVPTTCPDLPNLEHGTFYPQSCNSGKHIPGDTCYLECKSGYKSSYNKVIICMKNHEWNYNTSLIRCNRKQDGLTPFIICPEDINVQLKPHQQIARNVWISRPKSNVDWWKYVDSYPPWAKQLVGNFEPGKTLLTFRARTPASSEVAVCRFAVNVRVMEPLTVLRCPTSFEVQLNPGEKSRSVIWPVPQFQPTQQIMDLKTSHAPGTLLISGLHHIRYVATDFIGNKAECTFTINIRDRRAIRDIQQLSGTRYNLYLICENKSPRKISALKNIKRTPKGCAVRRIRNFQEKNLNDLH
ncbi:fibrillin-2-like [Ctenocephalides felis]|uniref:fibrillin-2-like n=1 Tax=Ctenocephalides felis TaxID=7515 RepID=UPI000E6E36AF|nr:fibrillin-2-like [Ctenocephalides felis]